MEFDFIQSVLNEKRDHLIADWRPYVDQVNDFMEKDGYSPLTTDQAGSMCEELEYMLKYADVKILNLRLSQTCTGHMQRAIKGQQK